MISVLFYWEQERRPKALEKNGNFPTPIFESYGKWIVWNLTRIKKNLLKGLPVKIMPRPFFWDTLSKFGFFDFRFLRSTQSKKNNFKKPRAFLKTNYFLNRVYNNIDFIQLQSKQTFRVITYVCTDRIFDSRLFSVHVQKNIFKQTIIEVCTSHLYASFGIFCVQMGHLFVTQWDFEHLEECRNFWYCKSHGKLLKNAWTSINRCFRRKCRRFRDSVECSKT